ncbi:MAG: hypothetical protein Q7S21_03855 [archaeon]|nr:hypothetical protein [archaeon]
MVLTRHRVKSYKRRMEKKGVKFGIEPVKEYDDRIRNRNLYEYMVKFRLNENALIGKDVLDVGSGEGLFVSEARIKGINAYGLEPRGILFSDEFIKKGMIQYFKSKKKFDYILAFASVPHYLVTAYNTRLSVYNMVKLLKSNGKLLICLVDTKKSKNEKEKIILVPTYVDNSKEGVKINTLINKLRSCGFACDVSHRVLQIERTPNADLDKLRRWLSLD